MRVRVVASDGMGRRSRRLFALLAAIMLAAAALVAVGPVPAAHAAARVDVAPTPNADGSTTVTLSGSGFQYLPNAPGGVYVFFGTVSDPATNAWAPSQGGRSGVTFGYAATSGSQLLAAFEGGASADEANAVIDANGNWTAQMTIPGSTFASTSGDPHAGASQSGSSVDCLRVMCGIITIGAHGAVNANNESFTPLGFVTAGGDVVSGQETPGFDDEATIVDIPAVEDDATPSAEPSASPDASESATPLAGENVAAPEDAGGADTLSVVVLSVLGVALLALIVALVVFLRARRRTPAAANAASANDAVAASDGEANDDDR